MPFTVAIDGPAAAGKGTIARRIASEFGFRHLDTGLLYRAVGRAVLDGADPVAAARDLMPDDLEAAGLRSGEVAEAASRVAALPEVREALLAFQRKFARLGAGAVLDGRDIGTVVCPEAEVKLFVTATPETRAARRHAELSAAGEDVSLDDVLADIHRRDARDSDRQDAPLKSSPEATMLDTSHLSIDAAASRAIAHVAARHARR